MQRRFAILGLVACLGIGACGGGGGGVDTGVDPSCTTPASGISMTAAEANLGAEVLVLTNVERANAGLGALSWHGQPTAAAVMTSWMSSTGHRDNILDTRFTRCSIGVYQIGGDTYWTMVLIREP